MKLLELQRLDTDIGRLKHKASALPVHQRVTTLMQSRSSCADDLVAAQTALSDATILAERSEADVVPVRERLQRNQARVDAGALDSKALPSALEEIEHLKRRISDLEDVALEALDAMEAATAQVEAATNQAQAIERDLQQEIATRDHEVGELGQQAKALGQERSALAAQFPGDLVTLYDKIRARAGGVGVARLEGHRCLGCEMAVTPGDYDRYMAAPVDEVIRCAECDRILLRQSLTPGG